MGGRPPGPSLVAMAGVVAGCARQPYEVMPELGRRYGDVVALPVPWPGPTVTLINHPDHVDHVMTRHHTRYTKHPSTAEITAGEPDALPLMHGEDVKRWRQPLNPYFTERALADVSGGVADAVDERVGEWTRLVGRDDWIDLEEELGTVVMDGLMRSMFGVNLDTATLRRYAAATREFGAYMIRRTLTYWLPGFVPRPGRRRGEAARDVIMAELDAIIARRRAEGPRPTTDLMDLLLAGAPPGCPAAQYRRTRSELSALVFGGFESTAAAVGWTIALLVAHPAALRRAHAEVDALHAGRIEHDHLERLPYLRACFDEALRLAGAPGNARVALEDDEIGGYAIPKDSQVMLSPYGLHRDPRFWRDPESYDPARFLTDRINRNAFLPFNVGPHKCLGFRLAYLEGVFALAAVLNRYTVTLRPGWTPKPKQRVATGLVGGLPVRLAARGTRRGE